MAFHEKHGRYPFMKKAPETCSDDSSAVNKAERLGDGKSGARGEGPKEAVTEVVVGERVDADTRA